MRRLLPLLLALAVLATAIPALAAKPAPEVVPTGDCVVFVEAHVPKGGKRVAAVTFAGETWTGDRFLNGRAHTFTAIAFTPIELPMQMVDHRGRVVYELTVPIACEVAPTRPSAG